MGGLKMASKRNRSWKFFSLFLAGLVFLMFAPGQSEAALWPAPVLESAQIQGNDYILKWSQPESLLGVPAGGYDIVIDGVDTNEEYRTNELSAVISGLETSVGHCFQVKARWTGYYNKFPLSNKICVSGVTPVSDVTAPSVSISSPAAGTTYASEQTVTVVASAQDNEGVAKVEFYDGAALIGTDTTNTFSVSFPVSEADNGTHTITAKAYDAAGNVQTSTPVELDVDIAPPAPAAPGAFEFAVSSCSVGEGDGTVNVTINRVGGSSGVATVDWRTSGVSATYDQDYKSFSWTTLTFADGETSKVKSIAIVDDSLAEEDETFKVLLDNPTGGASLGTITTSLVTITDNDEEVAPEPASDVTPPSISISSPAAGTTYTSEQTVTVVASAQDNEGVTKVEFYDSAALIGTDTTNTFSVSFPVSEADNGTHTIIAKAYDAAGNVQTSSPVELDVDIAPPAPAAPGAFEFAVSSCSVGEGDGTVNVTINRVGGSSGVATVDWRTIGVSATYDQDYGSFSWTTLTFADGETSKVKSIAIVDDSLAEGDETFKVLLDNPTGGASLGTIITAAVTIVDNDEANGSDPATVLEPTLSPDGKLLVFPGAQGFGTETPAGRGGKIIKVTNLNDSGTGSLRAAIDTSGPRIIVFEVGGQITLSSDLKISNPFVTIAGQTAPSPGITLKGAGIRVSTHDVLVQHLRIRVGDDPNGPSPSNRDALQIPTPGVYNVVVDHVSASWAIDENMSTWYEMSDITFSNCIISEGLHNSLHPEGAHSKGLLVGTGAKNISVIGNLIAHNHERFPRINGSTSAVVVNNLMYDAGNGYEYVAIGSSDGPTIASLVGNVFINGPSSPAGMKAIKVQSVAPAGTKVYQADNSYPGTIYSGSSSATSNTSPFDLSSITIRKSSAVESWVLSNAGSRPVNRDSVDERIVHETITRTGWIIDSPGQVGGWPNLPKTVRAFVIPDNPNGDDDGDGYTNIEEVLHQMAAEVEEE
jgi:hypothetical protein